jgi:protein tyrosine phosphatase (PTP) superfamily phosphohydrolase (DUF442 family)
MRFPRPAPFAWLPLFAVLLAAGPARLSEQTSSFPSLNEPSLQNAHRVTGKLLSGAAPEGDASFLALRRLGVKTIISVDGAKPDADTARRYGLRYVHLPIGYDDVTAEEGKAIAKAIDELDGPIYVHCHHGKHRSAAAIAVACVMNGRLKPEQAEAVLRTFGTGENYKGLWASAQNARPIGVEALREIKVDYREQAKIPPLADAMVAIDKTFERLKLAQKSGWTAPTVHPDIDPAHEALQLRERLHELGRTGEIQARAQPFHDLLSENEQAVRQLHELLSGRKPVAAEADRLFKSASASCAACHKAYRD